MGKGSTRYRAYWHIYLLVKKRHTNRRFARLILDNHKISNNRNALCHKCKNRTPCLSGSPLGFLLSLCSRSYLFVFRVKSKTYIRIPVLRKVNIYNLCQIILLTAPRRPLRYAARGVWLSARYAQSVLSGCRNKQRGGHRGQQSSCTSLSCNVCSLTACASSDGKVC